MKNDPRNHDRDARRGEELRLEELASVRGGAPDNPHAHLDFQQDRSVTQRLQLAFSDPG